MLATHNVPRSRRRDSAGVIVAPPVLFGAALSVGLLLSTVYPNAPSSGRIWQIVGIVLIVIGLMLSMAVMRAFRAAGTPVTLWRQTTRLVSTGPYHYTRNPRLPRADPHCAGIAIVMNS